VSVFDTNARRAAKADAAGFFRWVMPGLDPSLSFARWLDPRTVPAPREAELTSDTLAEFLNPARPEGPWIFVTEFMTEPTGDDLERVLEYMTRFRRERRPESDPRLKYNVGGVILNLTGPPQPDTLAMPVPGLTGIGTQFRATRRAMREEDAGATFTGIASGQTARSVLAWVPLMRGCGEASIIEEWKRLADREPNQELRLKYAAIALVFAELPGVWDEWRRALEGWNVRVSQQVLEWQAEARAEAELKRLRTDVLRALERRCKAPVPADIAQAVQATTDLNTLSRWFDAAIDAASYDDYRAAIK
jgi:hypothetical protein